MRIRAVGAAVVAIAAVLLASPPFVPPAAAADLSLKADPARAVAPAQVLLTGACAGEGDPDGGQIYPVEAFVTVVDTELAEQKIDNLVDGTFQAVPLDGADQLVPDAYNIQLRCPGSRLDTFVTADLTVLAPPTLLLDPVQGAAGSTVSASGTCPEAVEGTDILFDDATVATAEPDGAGGFAPTTFTVPAGADGPDHTVTTSCGGTAPFTLVLPAPVPGPKPVPGPVPVPVPVPGPVPGPAPAPSPSSVRVPDLTELTAGQALAVLTGAGLALADPGDGDGTVVSQEPAPGVLVPVGTPVAIVLAAAPEPASSSWPVGVVAAVVVAGAALLAVGTAALTKALRGRRRTLRERRWVEEQVTTALQFRGARSEPVPDVPVPALDVRLEVRSGATRVSVQEAVHVRD